ncbi:MAG: dihydrolipoamide acetyltransferase family protein [Myxococcota bacterium]|nr:dihydrolipoamide acetyltransferase family protein [Myxococcota bacterium]
MSTAVQLPELGESVVEGAIARWLVKEGDSVSVDQPLVEVTTDKVDAEIPSPVAGVVEKLLVAEGDTVPVGAELLRIAEGAEGSVAAKPASEPAAAPAESAAPAEKAPAAPPAPAAPVAPSVGDARTTPTAARFADAAGVDVGSVPGTGLGGRVTKDDVVDFLASRPMPGSAPTVSAPRPSAAATSGSSTAAPTPVSDATRERFGAYVPEEGDKVIPMSPLRRLVAEHMVYSKHTSPHVGTVAEADMSAVVALRAANKKAFQEANGIALTFLPFIVSATVRALREFPQLNASVLEDAIVEKRAIHLGIAVETDKGLMVPVIRNAERLSLAGLAAAIDDLSSRARNKKLKADELKGGTFTVTNPGRKGNLYGFAIINQPQVGIVRMGEMVKRPVVRTLGGEDAIVIRPMMHLALSYDHRAVDGAPANGFLFRIRELLEQADFDL